MDLDDWELSVEELDNLERDALKQIAERNASSSTATTSAASLQSTLPSAFPATYKREEASSAAPTIKSSSGEDKVSGTSSAGNSGPHDGNHVKQLKEKRSVKFFLHASGNIAAKFSYDQILVEACRKIPKASWSAKERLWMFPLSSLSIAGKVLREISGSNLELENLDPLVQRAIAAASAMPDLRDHYEFIPNSIESKLMPFQREGVRFALQHGGRILLADEMGLGKTLQAIAVVSCIRESWPVLVLVPSSLRLHWASMIQQWLNIPSSEILVVLSQWGGSNKAGFKIVPSNTKKSVHLDGVFNIVSYDIVPKLQDLLMASTFKVVIADESHFLKNAQAKRTGASLPLLQKAQYVILLSGTPALSRPIELFKQLEALYPNVYKNVHEYGNRYCKGGIFGVYQGASNHEELHSLMKATLMIRRLKKDVLSELPQKRRQQVFLDLGEKEMRHVNILFRELEVIKGKYKLAQSEEEAKSLKFAEKSLITKIYTASAEAKIPAVLDYLGTMVEADCKFLIFAHHQPMIESIHNYLLKKKVGCIRIDGSTPSALRQALVTDFQEKETIKAAVLSIKAGGVGLTLTAASTVIFAELSWTPGDLIQAEDRAHRIGQVSSVNVCYLLANDTVDDIIWDVVQSKLENLGQMLDGHEKSLEVSTNQSYSSPSKQKTLDSFIKRCNNSPPHELRKKHCHQ
ncbi:uncharacterized protein LOC107770343 [Nicotiana tabacum]|uniref:SWI/SNF-related matrix-associated actin-dependent regulator of chromatin subfamily A-like protein 1 isoform X1 n=4 Tax=Nicotiana TaxID=4085 RepID=A0A1S3XZJ5_TOBAC|nr:PREDICTED: SWI/SNF-related matrix-associated actin-dependent regulator of chromatin subfamily A-like protein 1 isoform X1 [Nicotiana sylvestris]XP_016445127.1 PREDICTED: SWI/SNF-related matrix-associated actin-dependent regulator of chromatin subfamily A-like protein 1 isoform X1 [Nicotiana tabacum]